MFCTYCGKEIENGALFCSECGKEVITQPSEATGQDSAVTIITDNKPNTTDAENSPKKKRGCLPGIIKALVFITVLVVIVSKVAGPKYDIEYSNNENIEKLPVTVETISYYTPANGGSVEATFTVKNNSNEALKDCMFIVMGWDEDEYPVMINNMYTMYWDYADYEYIDAYDAEIIKTGETKELTYTFGSDFANISYMTTFLVSCNDFDGESWENPIANDVIEKASNGCRMEDAEVYVFTFN